MHFCLITINNCPGGFVLTVMFRFRFVPSLVGFNLEGFPCMLST